MTQEILADHPSPRLDRFLAEALSITRSAAKKLIDEGTVLRDGKKLSAHTPIRLNDSLIVEDPVERPIPKPPDPRVIAETPEYVVIEKPAGLLVHPAPSALGEPTLVQWLTEHYPEIARLGGERPGIVHRLDRDVSGVMVVARTAEAAEHFHLLFESRQAEKHYRALVRGRVARAEGEIEFRLARSKTRPGRFAARPKNGEGRDATTRFTVLSGDGRFTFLDLELVTGRTHQLRTHLAAYGHPIVGDPRYGSPSKNLHRPFLHAYQLSFPDLSGNVQTFHSELPDDLLHVLKELLPIAVDPPEFPQTQSK